MLGLFTLFFIVVMINVLIAIVSDAYDNALATSKSLFYRSRFELVKDTTWYHPTWLGLFDDEVARMLKVELGHSATVTMTARRRAPTRAASMIL